ncbi:hypothetical protein FRC02_011513 [Tulasnella sp. 418]|nr:hypothetical protein FRC02_011513 [Tulasnella sp. 418]
MIFLLYIIFLSLTGSISTAAPNPASSVHKRQSEDNVVDHCWRKEFRSNKGMYTLVVRPGNVFYDKFSGICFYTVSYRSGLLKKEATITTYHGKDKKFRFDGNAYIELLRSRGDYIDANFR